MSIYFRSKYSHQQRPGLSLHKNKIWSDWAGVQEYQWWDSRHIVWKKSQFHIIEKNFEENAGISLIVAIIHQKTDFFEENNTCKNSWKQKSTEIILTNAKKSKIPTQIFHFENIKQCEQAFFQKKLQKYLILIISDDIPDHHSKLIPLSHRNEIIWIYPFYLFEKNPNNSILLESTIFNKKHLNKYLQELEEYEKKLQKFLHSHKMFYISTTIAEPIDATLNYFFKHTYASRQ